VGCPQSDGGQNGKADGGQGAEACGPDGCVV